MKIGNNNISNKNILIGILIAVIIILTKCSGDSNAELKKQQLISQNNIEVLNDSIKTFRTKNGNLVNERGVLIADKNNLKELNEELYYEYKELKKTIPNMKPKVIIKYKTRIVHDTVYLDNELIVVNDSTIQIKFSKDTVYSGENSRYIAGTVYARLLNDSTKYNKVVVDEITLTKDEMNIDASLTLGLKDDKLKVWLVTKYPGLEANQIEAVTLDPDIHPELRKLNNKKFSVGPYVGIGIGNNFTISPSIGIGIQYRLIKF